MSKKVIKLTLSEFEQLTEKQDDVLYIVDNKKFYIKNSFDEIKEVMKYVNVIYVDSNNQELFVKEYVAGEKIGLPVKVYIDYIDNKSEIVIYDDWICNNEKVKKFAPYEDSTYLGIPKNISLNTLCEIEVTNVYYQNCTTPIVITSDIPIFVKNEYQGAYYIEPTLMNNVQNEYIIYYTINPINSISMTKDVEFLIGLYSDKFFYNKIVDVNIVIRINVSNESSGD